MAATLALETGIDGSAQQPAQDAGPGTAWFTATVRPAGVFGCADAGRLRALLDALSSCASMVVLDLAAAQLCSLDTAMVVDEAARRLEAAGGALVCVHADPPSLAHLAAAGPHTVLMPASVP
ncbi:hypothetical protein DDP54_09755 [Cellulomonas sp. WB94]|uniref:hypothetical protein n=1 Tax=Cellulomonas sp. WB94 TaxID=2173174 RepID=UPI000D571980|nr:hypothetical protein [Cellulomonas sp. WB94]PVU83229.1 hypothetical protein DDP54_09755 [Cellulomonas sp. WB94]